METGGDSIGHSTRGYDGRRDFDKPPALVVWEISERLGDQQIAAIVDLYLDVVPSRRIGAGQATDIAQWLTREIVGDDGKGTSLVAPRVIDVNDITIPAIGERRAAISACTQYGADLSWVPHYALLKAAERRLPLCSSEREQIEVIAVLASAARGTSRFGWSDAELDSWCAIVETLESPRVACWAVEAFCPTAAPTSTDGDDDRLDIDFTPQLLAYLSGVRTALLASETRVRRLANIRNDSDARRACFQRHVRFGEALKARPYAPSNVFYTRRSPAHDWWVEWRPYILGEIDKPPIAHGE
jgi:hypothetical protein